MIISTTENIPNQEVKALLGLVKGSSVRVKHVGKDIFSSLKSIVGGELSAYTALLNEARDEALGRMTLEAQLLQADAIVNVRMSTSSVMQTASEILVYGTAVKFG